MSVAGKRAGLEGRQSCLFYQAIRIVKEMRCATDGKYPRFIVWENVPGAFSSNKGEDFKAVLEAVCSVKDESISVPGPPKGRWANAGSIVADGFSLAWRVFDSQFWGIPQRRKRIYLVADFAGGSAGKVLFESEGVSGYSAEGFRAWQGTAGGAADCIGAAGGICLNDQGGQRMDVTDDVTCTLRAEAHHPRAYWNRPVSARSIPQRRVGLGMRRKPRPRSVQGRSRLRWRSMRTIRRIRDIRGLWKRRLRSAPPTAWAAITSRSWWKRPRR